MALPRRRNLRPSGAGWAVTRPVRARPGIQAPWHGGWWVSQRGGAGLQEPPARSGPKIFSAAATLALEGQGVGPSRFSRSFTSSYCGFWNVAASRNHWKTRGPRTRLNPITPGNRRVPPGPPGISRRGELPCLCLDAGSRLRGPSSRGSPEASGLGRRPPLSPPPALLCGVCSALTSRGGRPSLGSVSAFGPGPDEVHSWFQGLYGVLLRPAWAPPAAQRRTRSPGGGLRGPGLGVAPVHVRLGPQAGGFGAAGAALPARPARSEPRGRASLC